MSTPFRVPANIWTELRSAPTSDFIYSSLSFLRTRFGNMVPGTWFVAALGEIGVDATAVRQTLFRMVKAGTLKATLRGRVNWYAPHGATVSVLDAGGERVREIVEDQWDSQWTIVHLRLEDSERQARDRLRDALMVRGFGRLRSGVYLHPRAAPEIALAAATDLGVADRVSVFRGARYGKPTDEQLVRELWDLPAVNARYGSFVKRYAGVARQSANSISNADAFALRFAYMFELFRITWDDPSLPSRFLPGEWKGNQAKELAATLRELLRPKALDFAEEIAGRVGWRTQTADAVEMLGNAVSNLTGTD